jgi:hypothetical protein
MQIHDHTTNPLFNPDVNAGEKTFKISGTPIEVVQALAYVKALGGGHVYITLGLIDSKHLYYKGQYASPEWRGRLNQEDFEAIQELTQTATYVKSIQPWAGQLVDHDLDKIDYTTDMDNRFNMHPMDRFGKVLNVHWTQWQRVRATSWLNIPAIPGRPMGKQVMFAGSGWEWREVYAAWRQQGIDNSSIFVGTTDEYQGFCLVTGLAPEHKNVTAVGELAQWIEGMTQIICTSHSWAPAIAQALNRQYLVQSRPDLQLWNNPYVLPERGNNSVF